MAVFLLNYCLLLLLGCISDLSSFSLQRTESDKVSPVGVEIDFYSDYEAKKFFDEFRRTQDKDMGHVFPHTYETNPPHSPSPDDDVSKKKMFLLFIPSNSNYTGGNDAPLDSWSVVWYIASFGGLIAFFLIVSCSEWCCRRAVRNNHNCNRSATIIPGTPTVPDAPPPSYDQFAPPSYESITLGRHESGSEKSQYDIYVVPVHALGTIMENPEVHDSPPSYLSAFRTDFVPACTPPRFPEISQESQPRDT